MHAVFRSLKADTDYREPYPGFSGGRCPAKNPSQGQIRKLHTYVQSMALKRRRLSAPSRPSASLSPALLLVYSPFCFCTHERSVNGSDVYVPLDRSAHVRQLRDGFLPTNGSTLRCERRRKKRLSSSLRKNGVDPSGEAVFSHMHETHASETPLSIQHSCLSMSE